MAFGAKLLNNLVSGPSGFVALHQSAALGTKNTSDSLPKQAPGLEGVQHRNKLSMIKARSRTMELRKTTDTYKPNEPNGVTYNIVYSSQ